jgi:LPS O-antigen subunit length determinant protein (WzzB/FepE family)
MNKKLSKYDDEIDLVKLIKIIWHYKIKIILITFSTIVLISGYSVIKKKPDSFQVSIDIGKNKNSEFDQLLYLKQISYGENYKEQIRNNNLNEVDEKNSQGAIYLNRFLEELMDFEEFLFILSKDNYVQKNIQPPLYSYSKLLTFEKNTNIINTDYFILNFNWQNAEDARKILDETLKLVSLNLKNTILKDIENYVKTNDRLSILSDQKKKKFLEEQFIIAKELGISDSLVKNIEIVDRFIDTYKKSSDLVQYYLRGYKAIGEEISLIEKREYYNLNVIQKEITNLKKINFKWADYDINRSEIKIINKYNYIKIFMISAILGLLISLVYVFVASAFQSQRPNNEIK